ncbi:MAG: hypothetical protein U9R02_00260 [Thermodesulfobacteriota bacterium]|nr:hypothetical protein [Thermodesulfobacteriota bacterium]
MAQSNKVSIISMVATIVIIGFILQVVFVYADKRDSPHKAVVEFSKAYFWLDKATMNKRLCNAQKTIDEVNAIDEYIQRATNEAGQMGFELNYMKNTVYHIKTQTLSKDDSKAVVRLTCCKKKAINPLYMTVARIFRLNKTYHIDETINVIKEDKTWKVCGKVFELTDNQDLT